MEFTESVKCWQLKFRVNLALTTKIFLIYDIAQISQCQGTNKQIVKHVEQRQSWSIM